MQIDKISMFMFTFRLQSAEWFWCVYHVTKWLANGHSTDTDQYKNNGNGRKC